MAETEAVPAKAKIDEKEYQRLKDELRNSTNGNPLAMLPMEINTHSTIEPEQDLILVHTNMNVNIWNVLPFGRDLQRIRTNLQELLKSDTGLVAMSLTANPWKGNYQTISVWKDTRSLASFYARGVHGKVMKDWRSKLDKPRNVDSDRYVVKMNQLPRKYGDLSKFWQLVRNRGLPLWKR